MRAYKSIDSRVDGWFFVFKSTKLEHQPGVFYVRDLVIWGSEFPIKYVSVIVDGEAAYSRADTMDWVETPEWPT